MASQHAATHLAAPPAQGGKRVHRHRRSAAISGDFDVSDLGLLSPPPPFSKGYRHSSTSSNPQISLSPSSLHQRLYLSLFAVRSSHSRMSSLDDSMLDRHFQFSNKDDFTNKPESEKFQFPSGPGTPINPPSTPKLNPASPRLFSGNISNLNSPIRLRNKKSGSVAASSIPSLFLTERTVLDSENVPNAVIDLDEVLAASHKPEGDDKYMDLSKELIEFPSSPRTADCSLPLSPYNVSNYLKQPLRELVSDPIEEEEDFEDARLGADITLTENQVNALDRSRTPNIVEPEGFVNPHETFNGVYQLQSANSSSSSIPSASFVPQRNFSATFIEKTPSNSSKDSGTSFILTSTGTPTSKRSSAKAARYQSFYDQSYKISSALKNSSTDSVHVVASLSDTSVFKDDTKSLGHSSSFPTLRPNVKRPVPLRFNEVRGKREGQSNSPPFPSTNRGAPQDILIKPSSKADVSVFVSPSRLPTLQGPSQMRAKEFASSPSTKTTVHSPSSMVSGFSSTVDTGGDALTDHSSVVSNVENPSIDNVNSPKPSQTVLPVHEKQISNLSVSQPPQIIVPIKISEALGTNSRSGSNTDHKTSNASWLDPISSPENIQHKARTPRKSLSSRPMSMHKGSKTEDASDDNVKKHSRRKSEFFSNWFRKNRS